MFQISKVNNHFDWIEVFVLVDIFSLTINTLKQKAALFYKVCQNYLTFSTIQKNVWSLNQRTSKFQNKSDPTALKGAVSKAFLGN